MNIEKKFCFPIIRYYKNLGLDVSGYNFEKLAQKYIERYQTKSAQCRLVPHAERVLEHLKIEVWCKS